MLMIKMIPELKARYTGETNDLSFVHNEIYDVYEDEKCRLFAYDLGVDDYYIENNPKFEILDTETFQRLIQLPEYQPHTCPVCNRYDFPVQESYRYCPVCGWHDSADLRYNGGLNADKYRELWIAGKVGPIESSEHLCPVCWKNKFSFSDSRETCPVCGWVDDLAQDQDENAEGANVATRREYKKAYRSGTLGKIMRSTTKGGIGE